MLVSAIAPAKALSNAQIEISKLRIQKRIKAIKEYHTGWNNKVEKAYASSLRKNQDQLRLVEYLLSEETMYRNYKIRTAQ